MKLSDESLLCRRIKRFNKFHPGTINWGDPRYLYQVLIASSVTEFKNSDFFDLPLEGYRIAELIRKILGYLDWNRVTKEEQTEKLMDLYNILTEKNVIDVNASNMIYNGYLDLEFLYQHPEVLDVCSYSNLEMTEFARFNSRDGHRLLYEFNSDPSNHLDQDNLIDIYLIFDDGSVWKTNSGEKRFLPNSGGNSFYATEVLSDGRFGKLAAIDILGGATKYMFFDLSSGNVDGFAEAIKKVFGEDGLKSDFPYDIDLIGVDPFICE